MRRVETAQPLNTSVDQNILVLIELALPTQECLNPEKWLIFAAMCHKDPQFWVKMFKKISML